MISETTDPSTVLLPNGNFISLGSFREFVHKHDLDREIKIGIESEHNMFFFSLTKKSYGNV